MAERGVPERTSLEPRGTRFEPRRNSKSGTGNHPMAAMSGKAGKFGGEIGAAPVKLNSSSMPPNFFPTTGGNSPQSGFMGTVGLGGRSATGPPAAALDQREPEMAEETMGMMTNHSAPIAKIARQLKHPLMDPSQIYQFLITQKEVADPILKRRNREARRYTMLNVPAYNFFLSMDKDNAAAMPRNRAEVKTADEVVAGWAFEGVVRTENAQKEMRYDNNLGEERLFNSVVRGFAFAFNTFGPNVTVGTRLYLIFRKRNLKPNMTAFKLKPWNENSIPFSTESLENQRTDMPFQVGFFGDYRYDYPPQSVLEYHDEFGFRHQGVAIYLGTAANNPAVTAASATHHPRMTQDLSIILSQPQMFMFVDWMA